MELITQILQRAINLEASDIHLAPNMVPIYRIKRKLHFDESKFPLSPAVLNQMLEFFYSKCRGLKEKYENKKQADFSYTYQSTRFRVNVSTTKGIPTFSFRTIPNGEINIHGLGITPIIQKLKRINTGLVLVTGKVNSGKSTTMNGFIQEINKETSKKIVTLEDPIEYVHESKKSVIIQKEIGVEADVMSYRDGIINLLREDSDIAVLGEIRDRHTMNVAIDLAESGGLVIGTLHTRSCGETVERILNMYEPDEQATIKNSVSSVLKMVVSQKLLPNKEGGLILVPEVMMVTNTIGALIRQEKFNVSDLEDTIHSQSDMGSLSFENSFADLYARGLIDFDIIKENVDPNRLTIIKSLIVNYGGTVRDTSTI